MTEDNHENMTPEEARQLKEAEEAVRHMQRREADISEAKRGGVPSPVDEPQAPARDRSQEFGKLEFDADQQGAGLMKPRNGKELLEFSRIMSRGGFMVKDFYRENPAACMNLILICAPYGLNPMLTSWKTYKASKGADAPISFEAQLINAMINLSAPVKGRLRYHYHGEGEELQCTVTGIERETGEPLEYTSPPLGAIYPKNSPLWNTDPKQQLGYYSSRAWARRHFPELLLGIYAPDEFGGREPVRDVSPEGAGAGGFAAAAKAARERAAHGGEEPIQIEAKVETPVDLKPEPEPDPIVLGEIPLEEANLKRASDLFEADNKEDKNGN